MLSKGFFCVTLPKSLMRWRRCLSDWFWNLINPRFHKILLNSILQFWTSDPWILLTLPHHFSPSAGGWFSLLGKSAAIPDFWNFFHDCPGGTWWYNCLYIFTWSPTAICLSWAPWLSSWWWMKKGFYMHDLKFRPQGHKNWSRNSSWIQITTKKTGVHLAWFHLKYPLYCKYLKTMYYSTSMHLAQMLEKQFVCFIWSFLPIVVKDANKSWANCIYSLQTGCDFNRFHIWCSSSVSFLHSLA